MSGGGAECPWEEPSVTQHLYLLATELTSLAQALGFSCLASPTDAFREQTSKSLFFFYLIFYLLLSFILKSALIGFNRAFGRPDDTSLTDFL